MERKLNQLTGDILLAVGTVAYLGAFPDHERKGAIGESYESFVRKRAHVKYQSQNAVIEMMLCFTILKIS